MTKNLSNRIERITERFLAGATILTVAALAYCIPVFMDKQYLNPEDFKEAQVIEYKNNNKNIWDEYMAEKIPHNSVNWKAYNDEMKKLNPKGYSGKIKAFDLDGDGTIGEQPQ